MNWAVALIGWIGIVIVIGFTWVSLHAGAWGAALVFDLVMVPFVIATMVMSRDQ